MESTRKDDFDWQTDGYNADKSLRYYQCKGWAVCKEIMNKVQAQSPGLIALIPDSGRRKLAEMAGLDISEFEYWEHDFSYTVSDQGLKVRIAVPNIWICVDLLHGGGFFNRIGPNVGGSIGQVISAAFTWEKQSINCRGDELEQIFAKYRGKIWGMVLYAHGSKLGTIRSSDRETEFSQGDLIELVKEQRFKLARLYLMQCYSGYEGTIPFEYKKLNYFIEYLKNSAPDVYAQCKTRQDFIEKYKETIKEFYEHMFRNIPECSCSVSISGETVKIDIQINWSSAWNHYVVGGRVIQYKGVNALAIDWWPIQKYFE